MNIFAFLRWVVACKVTLKFWYASWKKIFSWFINEAWRNGTRTYFWRREQLSQHIQVLWYRQPGTSHHRAPAYSPGTSCPRRDQPCSRRSNNPAHQQPPSRPIQPPIRKPPASSSTLSIESKTCKKKKRFFSSYFLVFYCFSSAILKST